MWTNSGHVISYFDFTPATHYLCYVQCLGCDYVIILGFSPVMYLSSNSGGYLHCSTVDAVTSGEISC